MVFSKKKNLNYSFILQDKQLEFVEKFSYLGIIFKYNGTFKKIRLTLFMLNTRFNTLVHIKYYFKTLSFNITKLKFFPHVRSTDRIKSLMSV
jgi:hypothetical protein